MILVDTSVWVDHLRRGNAGLSETLEQNAVVMHPFIVGEIACGSLANRAGVMELLGQLPMVAVAEPDEVLGFVEVHKLYGKGLGYVDVHLLASAAMGGAKLWTRDMRLDALARQLGLALPAVGGH